MVEEEVGVMVGVEVVVEGGGAGRPPLSDAQKFLLSWLHDLYEEGLL